jgi:hypothetical protein
MANIMTRIVSNILRPTELTTKNINPSFGCSSRYFQLLRNSGENSSLVELSDMTLSI